MKDSKIEWCHHTFNPWWGCAKVSAGCKNCYAESLSNRWGHSVWGVNAARKPMSEAYWRQPLAWNKAATSRKRVFCASMADVFESRLDLDEHRARLWSVIRQTPNLDWLLLTKRPENIMHMVPTSWQDQFPANVWCLTSVENQEVAEKRIPELLKVPCRIHGLSMEPLLGAVDLSKWIEQLQWVIVGGESGHGARPMQSGWVQGILNQCLSAKAEVPFFFKQWGEYNGLGERVGKKQAGRHFNGLIWNGVPDA